MFLLLNLIELLLKRLLPLFRDSRFFEIRQQWVRRHSIVQITEQAVDVVASDAEVVLLGLEDLDVVDSGEVCGGLWKGF